jgi:hypothetical protein
MIGGHSAMKPCRDARREQPGGRRASEVPSCSRLATAGHMLLRWHCLSHRDRLARWRAGELHQPSPIAYTGEPNSRSRPPRPPRDYRHHHARPSSHVPIWIGTWRFMGQK